MTLEEFKKQGYQLIQCIKITKKRSIDLNDYDPTKNEYETPFPLAYSSKDGYFNELIIPAKYKILDKNGDIVENNDNFNSFQNAINYIQNKM